MADTAPTPSDDSEVHAVLAANRSFYGAFEARDFDAMSDAWEHSDRVSCTHPGWRTLRGWGAVGGSWMALLSNAQHLQFIVTDERAEIDGDVAWVSCDENLLDGVTAGTVAALNVFVRDGQRWALVAHHGAPVAMT
jgi:ketosteroid isomerase-like protein